MLIIPIAVRIENGRLPFFFKLRNTSDSTKTTETTVMSIVAIFRF